MNGSAHPPQQIVEIQARIDEAKRTLQLHRLMYDELDHTMIAQIAVLESDRDRMMTLWEEGKLNGS